CGEQLAQALAKRGTVVIEAVVDTHEPPMPPKATLSQAAKLGKSLARGSPDGSKIARRITAGVVREII
ncbi:MAG TPA: pyruvate oxidase, partial [Kiloniellales bacterium]|nr:pyruvate oxidase [Kiloniellales bacterium]